MAPAHLFGGVPDDIAPERVRARTGLDAALQPLPPILQVCRPRTEPAPWSAPSPNGRKRPSLTPP